MPAFGADFWAARRANALAFDRNTRSSTSTRRARAVGRMRVNETCWRWAEVHGGDRTPPCELADALALEPNYDRWTRPASPPHNFLRHGRAEPARPYPPHDLLRLAELRRVSFPPPDLLTNSQHTTEQQTPIETPTTMSEP